MLYIGFPNNNVSIRRWKYRRGYRKSCENISLSVLQNDNYNEIDYDRDDESHNTDKVFNILLFNPLVPGHKISHILKPTCSFPRH